MRKVLRFIAIVLAVVIGLPLIAMGLLMFSMRDMRTGETGRIVDGVYCIKGMRVNCYAVSNKAGFILIDAGDNKDAVAAALASLSIDPARVTAVFLTHSDGDHTGALPLFTKANVYLSREESDLVTGVKLRHIMFMSKTNLLPVKSYIMVTNGEVIKGASSILALSTPGHTPGSYSYVVDGKYLFTGDSLVVVKGKIRDMGKPFTEEVARNKKSVDAIKKLSGITVLGTAHTGYSTNWNGIR
ncbi:MAG: MBL fold metallo-hydrolase [Spirochaetes bacterium]|nr:MBL fold metallo-hydrolase [Spirochaetota bacterium]